jgi:hypothetical protein
MRLDNLDKPKHYWYEDLDGNEIDWDWKSNNPFPDNYSEGEVYQHCISLEVSHSICKQHKKPAWPIRMLKWLISKMPNSWQGNPSQIFVGHSTIGSAYPIIKYLVENRKFRLDEAAILASKLCERCYNVCLKELGDKSIQINYRTPNVNCSSCKYIDPDYNQRHKLWCCYRTFKLGGSVKKALETGYVSSSEEYMKRNGITY